MNKIIYSQQFKDPLNGSELHYEKLSSMESLIYDKCTPEIENKLFESLRYINSTKDNYIEVNFITRYNYRPDLLSLDYYGVDSFSTLILSVNNIKSILNFNIKNPNIKKIKIPNGAAIQKYLID